MRLSDRVMEFATQNPTWTPALIARAVGCRAEYVRVCSQRYGLNLAKPKRSNWSAEELLMLRELRDIQKRPWSEIADMMGRPKATVAGKYTDMMRPKGHHRVSSTDIVPTECDEDRRRRQSLEPRDITASFMGDPLPGYSALERRV